MAITIQIGTIDDLQKIGNDPAYPLNGSYVLTQDIDASATATWNSGAGFLPIGGQSLSFIGTFDGQGHVVSGLTINSPSESYAGLFASVGPGAQLKNTGLEGSVVLGALYVGGLAGYNNYGTVTNCYATGKVSGSSFGDTVGGLVGYNYNGTVTNCYATDSVSGSGVGDIVGGLVGENYNGAVTQCYATGTIAAVSPSTNIPYSNYVGGIVGQNNYGTITQCWATGTVTAPGGDGYGDVYVGALVGRNDASITKSYATGKVSESGSLNQVSVGGLVGFNGGTVTLCYVVGAVSSSGSGRDSYDVGGLVGSNGGTVTQCYATSVATGGTGSIVGGLIGENGGKVNQCYATGAVTGPGYVGGLVGQASGTVTASYWDADTTGQATSAGGTGATGEPTAAMMSQATFAGWDFTTVWAITEGETYPWLQAIPPSQAILSISPSNQPVASASGATSFSVSNTGTGTMAWSAVVTAGASWLSISSGASGTNSGAINVSCSQNTGTSSRTGTIQVIASGATNSPTNVTVTQAAPQPILSVSPSIQAVGAASGATSFNVSNTGTGTMPWTASVTAGADWLSISSGASGTDSGTINVSYSQNTGSTSRTGMIQVTASGATGSPTNVTVTQAAPPQPILTVSPSNQGVGVGAGATSFAVSNTGTGTMAWTASVTAGADWLSIGSGASGTDSGTMSVSCSQNTGTGSRTGTIQVTAAGATGSPVSVTVTQAGTSSQPILTVSPSNQAVDAGGGAVSFNVSNTGAETMAWSASVVAGASWLSISSGGSGTDSGTISLSYLQNSGTGSRTGTIQVTGWAQPAVP